jgi:hypothetical protein
MPKIKIATVVFFGFVLASCSPRETVANLFYANDAAPWETVDAFYYPNRADLTINQSQMGLADVAGCRDAVRSMAALTNDPQLLRGDYECGVGRIDKPEYAGVNVYRLTVR